MRTIYHTGYLLLDRRRIAALDLLATELLKKAEAGKVRLLQRKLGFREYEYMWEPVSHEPPPPPRHYAERPRDPVLAV